MTQNPLPPIIILTQGGALGWLLLAFQAGSLQSVARNDQGWLRQPFRQHLVCKTSVTRASSPLTIQLRQKPQPYLLLKPGLKWHVEVPKKHEGTNFREKKGSINTLGTCPLRC